jgi:hypothetical protein
MPTIATIILVVFGVCSITTASRAEQSNSCKQCREQQQACAKNYSGKTCKTEYEHVHEILPTEIGTSITLIAAKRLA